MWLITKDGFYSVVEWQQPGDPNDGNLVVRARAKKDLARLKKIAPGLSKIAESPHADYRYRAWITREDFKGVLAVLADEIDYRNFKSAVGKKDRKRESLYHRVWSVLGDIQKGGPYGMRSRSRPWQPRSLYSELSAPAPSTLLEQDAELDALDDMWEAREREFDRRDS